jgi:hypothetical protein
MKLRLPVPSLALALTAFALALPSPAAYAQIGLYLNPVVTRASTSTPDVAPFAFLGDGATSRIFGGVDIGGYYTFAHYAKADVSADIRDTIQHGDNASLNSFLVGLRVAAKPMAFAGLKPYAQLSVGAGRTKAPLSPIHITKLEYGIFGGIDKAIASHVDWRIVEIGYGSVDPVSSDNFGGQIPINNVQLLSFSAGLVFRIH